jgi:hypothetical protein
VLRHMGWMGCLAAMLAAAPAARAAECPALFADFLARFETDREFQLRYVPPASHMVVEFEQPDSDAYSVNFNFTRTRGCWYLTLVDDQSL